MKKLLLVVLILLFALPAYARRTDLMGSYGFGSNSRSDEISGRNHVSSRTKYRKRSHRSNMYDKNFYSSKAARMLYENEHYNNTVDQYRYLKELRQIDLERRRKELGRRR